MKDRDNEDCVQEARSKGKRAFRSGTPREGNPYPIGTSDYRWWDDGFCTARKTSVSEIPEPDEYCAGCWYIKCRCNEPHPFTPNDEGFCTWCGSCAENAPSHTFVSDTGDNDGH